MIPIELSFFQVFLITVLRVLFRLNRFVHAKIVRYLNFYVLNWKCIKDGRLIYDSRIKCLQKVLVTGPGNVIIGARCSFGYSRGGFFSFGCNEFQTRDYRAKIIIGDNVSSNNNVFVCAMNQVTIGNDCLIGPFVAISDYEAHNSDPSRRNEIGQIGSVQIGNNVWIGSNVKILKNSIIGDNSIIAAGAIVTGVFPSNCILGGVPAKIIKEIE